MRAARLLAPALGVLLLSAIAGRCAAQAGRDPAGRDTTRRAAAADSARARAPSVVPADSLPSDDARAVLRTIPEPLAPDEQIEPADSLAAPAVAAPDTSAADTTGVPTPEPVAPLGEAPGSAGRNALGDSLGSMLERPAVIGVAPGSGPSRPAASDTCWRLQIAAPTDRQEGEGKRAAAESQLLVPMVIESVQGRHKVRSRDCLSHPAAEALKARALASGFDGAFLVRIGPDGAAIPVTAPAKKAAAPARKPAAAKPRASGGGTRR